MSSGTGSKATEKPCFRKEKKAVRKCDKEWEEKEEGRRGKKRKHRITKY